MKRIILFIVVMCSLEAVGQNQRIISYNLFDGTVDTLNSVDFDTTIANETTNYAIGNFNQELNVLDEDTPVGNNFPESNFSRKRQASLDFDINNYPIRTSVKLFRLVNDSIKSKCSGSLISRKHVLTAGHCVAETNRDALLYDSLFVCPVLDNGQVSSNFECSWVKRVFIFENWNWHNSDFSVLELEKPIGDDTGWISIGFESNDSLLLDGIFYKFSYPATTFLLIDSNSYNGDTLYYAYGNSDMVGENYFGVRNATGIPGESGSSLIKIENDKTYTSYGVFSFSFHMIHNRLTNWKYYAIKSIICNDLTVTIENVVEPPEILIFPVPTVDVLNFKYLGTDEIEKLVLFNLNGRKVLEKTNSSNQQQLNVSFLQNGTYILIISTNKRKIIYKIIKSGG